MKQDKEIKQAILNRMIKGFTSDSHIYLSRDLKKIKVSKYIFGERAFQTKRTERLRSQDPV